MSNIFVLLRKGFGLINRKRWILRAFIPSLIFNLRHLPFSQARKMPILIYKGRFKNNSGRYIINGKIKFGMIELGRYNVSLFPSNGILLENRGTVVFNGSAIIGNDSAISLGQRGRLEFGENFVATAGLRLACYDSITFGQNVLIGWNNMFIDTDFHKLKYADGKTADREYYAPIIVGHDTWLGNGCKVYKGVIIPPRCIVGADTILHKSPECEEYSLIRSKIDTLTTYISCYLDVNDKNIDYDIL